MIFCALTLCLNRHFRPNSLVITRREKQDDNLGVTICKYLTTDKWPKAKLFKLPIKIRVSSSFPFSIFCTRKKLCLCEVNRTQKQCRPLYNLCECPSFCGSAFDKHICENWKMVMEETRLLL